MLNIVWIGLAGGLGSIVRYLVGGCALRYLGTSFPYGTLTVNLVGSFMMGLLVELSLGTNWISPGLRLVLATGFLGGFTTYSSFNQETVQSLQAGDYSKAFLYLLSTLVLCLAAGFLGWGLGRRLSALPY